MNEEIKAYNHSFDEDLVEYGTIPDVFNYSEGNKIEVPDDFVLCRDLEGMSTAIFKEDTWDYNPYRLSATKLTKWHFSKLLLGKNPAAERAIIIELKYLLFCMMYFCESGYTGTRSSSVMFSYFTVLRQAARFCLDLELTTHGNLTLKHLFTNKPFLAAFVRNKKGITFNKRMSAIINDFNFLGEKIIGFTVVNREDVDLNETDSQQTVIIPQRIYMSLMNNLENDIDFIYENSDGLEEMLPKFKDRYYGVSHGRQKGLAVGGRKYYRETMSQAIVSHGLSKLLKDNYKVTKKNNLTLALSKIQFIAKQVIHLYTGMRHQEVNRLPYECVYTETITEATVDEKGKIVDEALAVELLSTTTKFTGYKESASWYAPKCVLKAIKILQRIARGMAGFYNVAYETIPLLVSTSELRTLMDGKPEVTNFNTSKHSPHWLSLLTITGIDLIDLRASDEDRDFLSDKKFQVGNSWPLASHQFRRSLAFYASNSGFVSLPTLKAQFKHLSLEMARYYRRNFEQIKTIFGYFDKEKGEYILPDDHMIFEYQLGIPGNVANQILIDVLGADNHIYGKTGRYIERQKEQLKDNEILIQEVRKETEKRVAKGELSYRDTLLGGCIKVGACEDEMLGDFTSCLGCKGGIINPNKVDKAIDRIKEELAEYAKDSAEYQITIIDYDALVKYKKYSMKSKDEEPA
ncbi:MAG: hypothetical protein JKX78_07755 [Alteromonadaceae bacterium]|nr:hypothetical protein [Alteromonadaceae bacterium]